MNFYWDGASLISYCIYLRIVLVRLFVVFFFTCITTVHLVEYCLHNKHSTNVLFCDFLLYFQNFKTYLLLTQWTYHQKTKTLIRYLDYKQKFDFLRVFKFFFQKLYIQNLPKKTHPKKTKIFLVQGYCINY